MSETLTELLRRIEPAFQVEGATEICLNRCDGVAHVATNSGWIEVSCPGANYAWAESFSRAAGNNAGGRGGRMAKLLEVELPGSLRAIFVSPPLCEKNTMVVSIRLPSSRFLTHDELALGGLYDMAKLERGELQDFERQLLSLYNEAKNTPEPKEKGVIIKRFMELAVESGRTIFIAGGTNFGKTTLQKALAALIPKYLRIITLENTRELLLPNHPNHIHLVYDNSQGEGAYSPDDLMMAALRLRPDRLLFAEVRTGLEAKTFVRALRSGHQAAMATGHAGSVAETFSMLARNVSDGGDIQSVIEELKQSIDIVAVFGVTYDGGVLRRHIVELYYDPERKRAL